METHVQLISKCGLYCGNCRSYKKAKCPGCLTNEKATWCKIRTCCLSNGYGSCADCKEFSDPMLCHKFNNFISKVFSLLFKSDRATAISMIRKDGQANFATYMVTHNLQSIKRK